ncbi:MULTISPECIES: YczE/YyaS/YitT family protein [Clostridium]|uniref:YczE/YyaS/YitT family protein n=1 Tax=Clostridium TaxID=1485 RepID=UPI00082578D0|nr:MULTISPECIES: DUF6198 family protein [Clostridium]PJI08603.1 hypothetical protein CUB90_12355 [Clostridium sp. CT7]
MKNCYRALIYCIGLVVLSLGIILNTKTGLGVSPIISIPYCISKIWKINLGNITAVVYILCVFGQMLLLGKKFRAFDLLQIPMSIVISQIINFFNDIITISSNNFIVNLILLIIAIMLTGIGVVMTVQMRFVPNAADGFTQAVSRRTGISLGLAKNIVDVSSVLITVTIGFLFTKQVIGIGLGTLIAVFGVGRSIALVNRLFKNKMLALVE